MRPFKQIISALLVACALPAGAVPVFAAGGVGNTGSTTIRADWDGDGVGVNAPQGKNAHAGLQTQGGGLLNEDVPLDGSNLAAVVAAIGSAQKTLRIATAQSISADLTIPENVTLEFTGTGSIKVASTRVLTIKGPLVAPARKIFFNALASQGAVSFAGNRSLTDIYPQWWGAVPDWTKTAPTSGTDNSAYLRAAGIAASGAADASGQWTTRARLRLPGGKYYVNSGSSEIMLLTRPMIFEGDGKMASKIVLGPSVGPNVDVIRIAPAVPALRTGEGVRGWVFRDFGVQNANESYDSNFRGRHVINVDVTASSVGVWESLFENLFLEGTNGYGFYVTKNAAPAGNWAVGYTTAIRNSTIIGGLYLEGMLDTVVIDNCYLAGHNEVYYAGLGGASTFIFQNNNVTMWKGMRVASAYGAVIQNNIFEAITANHTGTDGALLSFHGVGSAAAGRVVGPVSVRSNTFVNALAATHLRGIRTENANYILVDSSNVFDLQFNDLPVVEVGPNCDYVQLPSNPRIVSGRPISASGSSATETVDVVAWIQGDSATLPVSPSALSQDNVITRKVQFRDAVNFAEVTPAAGRFIMAIDAASGCLKVKASTGAVATILCP